MDLLKTPHKTATHGNDHEVPIISALYVLAPSLETPARRRANSPGLFSAFAPYMNWSSTLYFISDNLPHDFTFLSKLIDEATTFLIENHYCHLTVRPVHPVRAEDADILMDHYTRLMASVRPFQREAYTTQGISRLLIFPVLFINDMKDYLTAVRIGTYAETCFMLPSIALPGSLADRTAGPWQGEGQGTPQPGPPPPPWVRLYITPADSFDPDALMGLFYDHQIATLLSTEPFASAPLLLALLRTRHLCVTVTASGSVGIWRPAPVASRPSPCRSDPPLTPERIGRALSSDKLLEDLSDHDPSSLRSLAQSLDRLEPTFLVNHESHQLADMRIALADLFERRGSWHEALSQRQRALTLNPGLGSLAAYWLRTGICHYHLEEYDAAMGSLQKAYALSPTAPEVCYYMGLCEYAWRDYILATERLSRVLDLDPPPSLRRDACFYLGISHYLLEEFDEALHWLQQALQLGRADATLHFYLGLALLGKNRPNEALDYLKQSLSLDHATTETFNILFYIAHTLKELGSYEEALAALAKAEALDPKSYEVFNLKGFCLFELRRFDEAIEALQTAVRIDPRAAIDYASIGSCLREKGELAAAKEMYKKALAIDPRIDFAKENLAKIESILRP